VDGGVFATYELLPGRHLIRFTAHDSRPGFFTTTMYNSGRMGVCFSAEPGHSYEVYTVLTTEGDWRSTVVDAKSRKPAPLLICRGDDVLGASQAVLESPIRPRMSLDFGFFGDIGGDNLLTATMSDGSKQVLSAGAGFGLGIGVTATPWWFGDLVGLGVGTQVGFTYDSVDAQNGSIHLVRYPFSLFLRSYLAIDERWYFSLAGGAYKDVGAGLSGNGVAAGLQADFTPSWGWMMDAGVLYAESWHTGLGFSIGYASERYAILPGMSIDASHVNLRMTLAFMR
jgi:hypothetical protein